MSNTFFLNFNQKNRDKFIQDFAKSIDKQVFILDVGAGSAPYRNLFMNHDYKTHDFQKLNPEQLLHKKGYSDIDIVSDIISIPLDSNSVDVILCTEVLEHVPDPISALKEMSRLLKSGGEIVITTPLGSHIHQEPFHYYGGYTPYFYKKFLEEFGFTKIEIKPNKGFFNFYFQESMRFFKLCLSNKSSLLLFICISPVYFLWIFLLLIFRNFLDKTLNDSRYTVGYHVLATKI